MKAKGAAKASQVRTPMLADGQRWHVIHGDALEVMAGMGDAAVDHVLADPPYDDRTSKNARSNRDTRARFIDFGGISPESIAPAMITVARRWAVAFCALEQLGAYQAAAGKRWIRAGTWHRTNPAPQITGDRPGQADEGVAIMHRKGRKRWNNGGHAAWWSGPTAHPRDRFGGHPTPKPLWLMMQLVEQFTDPGDVILDPFAGSGTTGAAALRLGRRVILDEKAHDVASPNSGACPLRSASTVLCCSSARIRSQQSWAHRSSRSTRASPPRERAAVERWGLRRCAARRPR